MKHLLLILTLVFTIPQLFAQTKESKNDKLQALLVAHITEEIELSSDEAQSFWPLFNDIRDSRRRAERQKRKLIKTIEKDFATIGDSEAQKYVEQLKIIEQRIANSYFSEKHNQIIEIIGAKRFLLLQHAEMDFRRDMIKRFKERRKK